MSNMNYLVCWEENNVKKWEMVREEDNSAFSLTLLRNPDVNKHSIFLIPCTGFVGGVWLWKFTHKSSRIDFWHFFEEYGTEYHKPEGTDEDKKILKEIHERNNEDTKYGWISPNGKYYHCGYQGHANLADKICFGMIETNNAEHYLEEHGWCKIYKSMFEPKYHVYIGGRHVITREQMTTLTKMGLENVEDIDKMLAKE